VKWRFCSNYQSGSQHRRYNLRIMRMNAHMKRLLPVGLIAARQLQPTLLEIAERKLTRADGCIVFEGARADGSSFPDKTGYECFANHIHVDDSVPKCSPEIVVEQAVALGASLNARLRTMAPTMTFRFIVSLHNDGGCTLRFHTCSMAPSGHRNVRTLSDGAFISTPRTLSVC